jgi:hypothetical protein
MGFNSEALERGIEQCKTNIKTFEDAIQKERDTIKEYYKQIEHNQEQDRMNKIKEAYLKNNIDIINESE